MLDNFDPKPKSLPQDIIELRDQILPNHLEKIEAEFKRSPNPYCACIATRIAIVSSLLLDIPEMKEYLGAKKVQIVSDKIKEFQIKLADFRKTYGDTKEIEVSIDEMNKVTELAAELDSLNAYFK